MKAAYELAQRAKERIALIEQTAKDRIAICRDCNKYNGKVCELCGCFMLAKVRVPNAKCPDSKW